MFSFDTEELFGKKVASRVKCHAETTEEFLFYFLKQANCVKRKNSVKSWIDKKFEKTVEWDSGKCAWKN